MSGKRFQVRVQFEPLVFNFVDLVLEFDLVTDERVECSALIHLITRVITIGCCKMALDLGEFPL